jgi:predicted ATPase
MRKIRIKNFGPIKEGFEGNNGWLELKKFTVFIGNQGSGKSTIAKMISTLTWIEKALVRGDYPEKEFTNHSRFIKKYSSYHKLENYFDGLDGIDRAEIEYEGDAYYFKYSNKKFTVEKKQNISYLLPQIMYIPAERNFISTIDNPKMIRLSSGPLVEFLSEFDKAKQEIKDSVTLPLSNAKLEYDRLNDIVNVRGEDYKIRLTEASSGYQSAIPLFLVSRYLATNIRQQNENSQEELSTDELNRFRKGVEFIYSDDSLTDEQKRIAISALSTRFKKSTFVNIVEEPEQNLFPSSQRQMMNNLIEFANMNQGNQLIITTHSPYIINYFTLSIKAKNVFDKVTNCGGEKISITGIFTIVPEKSFVATQDLIIYELSDKGQIIKLADYKGLPSDENYLNEKLAETNDLFANLLEIEDSCQ